jgi:hypothetical protein
MIIRNESFVYTNQIRPGVTVGLKNGLIVIGVEDELEAQLRIFQTRTPQELLDEEEAIYDIYHEVSEQVSGQLSDSVDELFDALMDHVSTIEERAFKAGYLAAKKEECSVATTEHSGYMAR